MAKLAFYNGEDDNLVYRWLDFLVVIWTRSKITHVELIDDRVDVNNPKMWNWYSASSLIEKQVRMKHVDYKPHHWVIYDFPDVDIDKAIEFFKGEEGKPYDWLGIIFSQFIPFGIQSPSRWFCSEIVTKMIQVSSDLLHDKTPNKVSPINLYKYLHRLGKLNNEWNIK